MSVFCSELVYRFLRAGSRVPQNILNRSDPVGMSLFSMSLILCLDRVAKSGQIIGVFDLIKAVFPLRSHPGFIHKIVSLETIPVDIPGTSFTVDMSCILQIKSAVIVACFKDPCLS